MMTPVPSLKPRPKLDRWLRDRGLGAGALGERWGITRQGASRYLLPFGHVSRIVPNERQIADCFDWTLGEVVAADWYPAQLSGAPLSATVGDIGGGQQVPRP